MLPKVGETDGCGYLKRATAETYSDMIGQAKNRLCKTGQDLADKRPTLASIATKEYLGVA